MSSQDPHDSDKISNNPKDAGMSTLDDRLRGPVVRPGDPGYEELRSGWNGRLVRRPGGVALCSGAADVRSVVRLARERSLPLAVRSGGHSYAGHSTCDDGLVLDLSRMDGVRVDPEARTARVQPGARWGAVDHEAQAFGLVTPGGTVSTVGVGGLALGGGSGHLVRRYGLTLDNLLSADVVTAGGELVQADADRNPDLFWGLRGAGANLGVVTSLEFRLHDFGPQVMAGQVIYPFGAAPDVLRAYRDLMLEAPDALQCYAFFFRLPADPAFPEDRHGEIVLDLIVSYAGSPEEGREFVQPFRELSDPVADFVQPTRFTDLQKSFDAGLPAGERYYSRAHYLQGLPDEAIEVLVESVEGMKGTFTMAYLEPMGGAVGRIPPGATAFAHRTAPFSFHVLSGWSDPAQDDETMAWTRELHGAMKPFSTGGVYVNLLGEDEGARARAAYGSNYERLQRVKAEWDPDNLFRTNANIVPAE